MTAGRKPWIPTELDLQRAERLASRGLSMQQIAHNLGIAQSTLYSKSDKFPELMERIKKGAAKGIEEISNKLFEMALAGNVTAMIFFLKTRAGWKEGQEIDFRQSLTLDDF